MNQTYMQQFLVDGSHRADERSIKSSARHRHLGLLHSKSEDDANQVGGHHPAAHPFPSLMIVTLVSSAGIVLFVAGLVVIRYLTQSSRREKQPSDASYSISRYWRRQVTSTSFDSLSPLAADQNSQQAATETTRIIKSSFSWPEATLHHQQQQQQQQQMKGEVSSTISSASSLSNSSTMEHLHEPASLTFGLRWNEQTGSLFVRVVNARDLLLPRRNRPSILIDSYVRIELIADETDRSQDPFQSMRTHIVRKNAHPVYDELFEFAHVRQMEQQPLSLLFTLLTYDTFTRDEILGQVLFPLTRPEPFDSTETTFTQPITPRHVQMCNQQLGQMLISLCYQPSDSTITLIALKASNLPRIGTTRMINPYFKIYMYYKKQRLMKKRSTIKRTTQSPVYNECFFFPVPDNDIADVHFDFVLFDYDRHMKHEPIGTFSIGSHANELNSHWKDVCERQVSKQIAQWYQLKPFNQLFDDGDARCDP